ncbi:hypothetical protein G5V59_10585 [Nocardioides sp. W3-2-3]|uniref:hypothetical protein n=1 Tax=Nocardioides convexus TaxID=2712224 RepID=UPI0024188279|nr:hypothetical protein [Nocardioides convexus]NHA00386.1 hypothetical protein [Nocardioides convexus]
MTDQNRIEAIQAVVDRVRLVAGRRDRGHRGRGGSARAPTRSGSTCPRTTSARLADAIEDEHGAVDAQAVLGA